MLLSQRPVPGELVPGVETLQVRSLSADCAQELLDASRDQPVPEHVARRVLETAAGNPLALREIPALLSHDELEGRAPIEGPLPARLDARARPRPPPRGTRRRDPPRAAGRRRGRGAPRRLVLRALTAAGLDVGALEPAEAAGIVTLGPGEVAFRHPLLRAAAYHGGSVVERRAAHRAVAQALPERRSPARVAARRRHRAAGRVGRRRARRCRAPGPGAHRLRAAAHAHLRAAELSPNPVERARRLVEAARDLLPAGYPEVGLARLEQAERVLAIADSGDVSAVAADLRTLRAQLALRTGRIAEAREMLRAQARRLQVEAPPTAAMLLLLSSLGSMALRDHVGWLADAERALALSGDAELLAALAGLSAGAARMTVPDVAAGRALLEDGEQRLGEDLGMALSLAPELVALAGHGWLWIEEYERGVELLDRLVAAGRESASVGALPYPLAARAQGNLYLGHYGRALADAEEAVALAEQTGQDPALVIALGILATVRAWHGDSDAANDAAAQALALAERRRVPLPAIYAHYALAMLAVASDRAEEAVERLELVRAEALPGNVLWAPHLVDAYVRAGRRDDATALVEHYARSIEHRRIAPAMLERVRALIAPADQAEAHFQAALDLHAAGPAPFELARTRLAYGEWLLAQDRRDDAREQLRAALAGFEQVEALPFAEHARHTLRAAGAATRAAPERAADLTPHELRVAQLVAQGLTNREAAAALFVSAKTIEHHLRNVFRKLGIRRRAELARLMAVR